MSFYGERREVPQPTRIEWACYDETRTDRILWVDVARTQHSAIKEYNQMHGRPDDSEPFDDAIQVEIRDGEIVFWFEKPAP